MSLSRKYTDFLLELCDRTYKETGGVYNPTRLRSLVAAHGGAWATYRILMKKEPNLGLGKLWELGRLDLSLEAQLLQHEEFHPLFAPSVPKACKRVLEDHNYFVPVADASTGEATPQGA